MTAATRTSQICIFNENNSDVCKLCTPRTCVFDFGTILSRPLWNNDMKQQHLQSRGRRQYTTFNFAFHFLNFSFVHASFRQLMIILDSKQFPYVTKNTNLYFMDIFIVEELSPPGGRERLYCFPLFAQDHPRSQGLSSLPPLVVGTETLGTRLAQDRLITTSVTSQLRLAWLV